MEATAGLHMDHMGAPKDFGRKCGRKNDQNLPNFFFQKIDIKKRSETRFHKNRTKTRNFNLFTARHEKSTAPESGTNSSVRAEKCLSSATVVGQKNNTH